MKAGFIVSCWLTLLSLLGIATVTPSPGVAQCCGTAQCGGDFNCDGQVTIDEILAVVNNALLGCPKPVSNDQACADLATASCNKLDFWNRPPCRQLNLAKVTTTDDGALNPG